MKLFGTRRLFPGKPAAFWWDPNNDGLCIWSAYQPKGAANFAASLLDLSGNGNNAGDPGGAATPPWDNVNGWKFDGIADYLTTTFVPQNDQTQTMLIQLTNGGTGVKVIAGENQAFPFYIRPSRGIPQHNFLHGGQTAVAPDVVAGNIGIAGNQGYVNGAASGGAIPGGAGASVAVWIGGLNNFGALATPWDGYIQAFALYDCTLTAPQVLAVATAMAAL